MLLSELGGKLPPLLLLAACLSALVLTESKKGNHFMYMLAVFFKSVVLRTKVPFNKS